MYPEDQAAGNGAAPDIPLPELVGQVYESAPPAVQSSMVTQLVAQVYEAAPLGLRTRLLEQLLRPLGVLSLVAVANGVFANMRIRADWSEAPLRLDEVQNVRASDVVALVDRVQQVSMEAVNGVARLVSASPVLAGSAAAAVLVTVLLKQRSRNRRASDRDEAGAAA
jgi:hypothetical protein